MSTVTSGYNLRIELKGAKGAINALTFSKDGKLMLSGGDDGNVRVYNTDTFACEQVLHSSNWGQVTALNWLVVEPPVDDKATSVCVGTGRGSVTLCPMSKTSTWFVWKDSQTVAAFAFNDAVEAQAYDPLNRRLAVASHSGAIKVYNVDKCVTLTPLWGATTGHAIPRGLKFFGGANQFILCHGLETGDMVSRDAQTSNVQWRKTLPGAIGNAALSPDEGLLLVDNLTTGIFDLYRFPSSTPSISFPFSSSRRFTKQCTFSEAGKVAVCGSDHGKVYVMDVATGESIQALQTTTEFDLVQVVAAAALDDGRHLIAGGTSSVGARVCVWEKRPPVAEPAVHVAPRSHRKITQQSMLNVLFVVLLLLVSYPNWSSSLRNSIAATETLSQDPVANAQVAISVSSHSKKVQQEPNSNIRGNMVPRVTVPAPMEAKPAHRGGIKIPAISRDSEKDPLAVADAILL